MVDLALRAVCIETVGEVKATHNRTHRRFPAQRRAGRMPCVEWPNRPSYDTVFSTDGAAARTAAASEGASKRP